MKTCNTVPGKGLHALHGRTELIDGKLQWVPGAQASDDTAVLRGIEEPFQRGRRPASDAGQAWPRRDQDLGRQAAASHGEGAGHRVRFAGSRAGSVR